MSVWFVKGLADDGGVQAVVSETGRVDFSTLGSVNVYRQLASEFPSREFLLPGKHGRRLLSMTDPPGLIFNEISNPDTHRAALQHCERLCERLQCPVINRPEAVLATSRDAVARRLGAIPGVIAPSTLRCSPRSPQDVLDLAEAHGLGDTFLIREAGKHGGKTLLKVSASDQEGLLHRLAYDGREFYLSEFIDARSVDGLYRKYRLVVVDGEVLPRHLLISPQWMVHASAAAEMERRPDWLGEEIRTLERFDAETRPAIQPRITAIHEAMGLDYFGVDCHIDDSGVLTVYEANCNMNVLVNTRANKAATQPYVERIRQRLITAISDRIAHDGPLRRGLQPARS